MAPVLLCLSTGLATPEVCVVTSPLESVTVTTTELKTTVWPLETDTASELAGADVVEGALVIDADADADTEAVVDAEIDCDTDEVVDTADDDDEEEEGGGLDDEDGGGLEEVDEGRSSFDDEEDIMSR